VSVGDDVSLVDEVLENEALVEVLEMVDEYVSHIELKSSYISSTCFELI